MAKLGLVLFLLVITTLLAQIYHVESWARTLVETKKETISNLQFYFHDTLSGSNPTAVKVAQAADTDKSLTRFGTLMMVDDPLTETRDPNSKLVGRAQGLYGSAGQKDISLIMAMGFAFTDGKYKDSCISITGKNPAMNPVREMPIVGGTGIFRMARGYAIAETQWLDPVTGDALVKYNVTVYH